MKNQFVCNHLIVQHVKFHYNITMLRNFETNFQMWSGGKREVEKISWFHVPNSIT